MNRTILTDMLNDEYDIIEAENGRQAIEIIESRGAELSLILLDIVMPEVDGFGVLMEMNRNNWMEEIPVIMISSETGAVHIKRAYELGVTDFISRPFDAYIVYRRVNNTILLYAKQKKLMALAAEQAYEKEQQSNLMIDILSHIVEFRNGESSSHVRHVHSLTEQLLKKLVQKTDSYQLTRRDIATISTASALHDIGKIAIPEEVLNKPGRLTAEEFEVMKTHSMIGAKMLEDLPIYQNEPLVKAAYEICRWHHERYDGKGYPDGLRGDEIPISAQIVSIADVYDALTGKRVYKDAIAHDKAIQMIVDGQCGAFNPLIIECLLECGHELERITEDSMQLERQWMQNAAEEIMQHEGLTGSNRTLTLLENERIKQDFYAALTTEIQFEVSLSPLMVTLSPFGAAKLGLPEIIMDPMQDATLLSLVDQKVLERFVDTQKATTPQKPESTFDCQINLGGEKRWFRIYSRAFWSADEPPVYTGAIGKCVDIHDLRTQLKEFERQAESDSMTGLLNHAAAKRRIADRLKEKPEGRYALVIFDLDDFKGVNDNYGHQFGDRVLKYTARQLCGSIRGNDIVARVGGDEFLLFLEYKNDLEPIIERIFNSLSGNFEHFTVSLSMGVAETDVVGSDYEELFRAADNALYTVKRSGHGRYEFYNKSMYDTLSAISPIEETVEESGQE